ncbi:hypothetical protein [Archangium sp.]|jgi:hypothetical protein|uniref:hypothetical protein n=1 Tax=Archangium sp. TaxID=1872627 RepID=UPI002ED8955A
MAQTEDTSEAGAHGDCQIPLGYDGVVRIRAVPRIVLSPQKQTQPPLQNLDAWEVVVGGSCENVAGLPPCRLEWIVTSDCLDERRIPHPRETCLVPSGKRFAVREKDGDGSKALRLSAFELGLIGKGRLGFRIEPALSGNEPVEVLPGDARAIPYELEANIGFSVAPAELTSGWVPDWLELALHSNRVGTLMQLTPSFSKLFAGLLATLEIFPAGPQPDKDATVRIEWEIGDPNATSLLLWKIGFTSVRGAQGELLNDRLAVLGENEPPSETVAFHYKLTVARKPPPPAEGKGKNAKKPASPASGPALRAVPRLALEVPRPRLKTFEVLLDKGKLSVQGSFEGFSDSVALDMVLKPYVRLVAGEAMELQELDNYFRSMLQSVLLQASVPRDYQGRQLLAVCSPLDVDSRLSALDFVGLTSTKNAFQHELLDLKSLPREYVAALKEIPGLQVFAVLKIAPGLIGKEVPFGTLVDYEASEPGIPGGYAPFHNGTFMSKEFASGVCTSNTVDLSGHAAELHTPLPTIPPELQEDFEIFVATIWGEAISESDESWKAVAHTIMNRVARNFETWKRCLSPTEVIQKTGFDAYNKELYLKAREHMKAPATAAFKDRDKLQRLVTLVTPIFMRQAGDGEGVVYYYSPRAQAALAAKEAKEGKPPRPLIPPFVNQGGNGALVRVTEQVLGDGWKRDDFEFYAFQNPNKVPWLTEEEIAKERQKRKAAQGR